MNMVPCEARHCKLQNGVMCKVMCRLSLDAVIVPGKCEFKQQRARVLILWSLP